MITFIHYSSLQFNILLAVPFKFPVTDLSLYYGDPIKYPLKPLENHANNVAMGLASLNWRKPSRRMLTNIHAQKSFMNLVK